MKILFLIISIIHLIAPITAQLSCDYNFNINYWILGRVYRCTLLDHPNFNSSQIENPTGRHMPGKSNNDVVGFDSYMKNIQLFPRLLENIFRNLKLITIWYGRIDEIHQADLKPFRKLVYLSLNENNIEILESGLFDYNVDLEVISFSNNRIKHIDENVFDNLKKLSYLVLDFNPCINLIARANRAYVAEVIQVAKEKCIDDKYVSELEESNRISKSRKFDENSEEKVKMMETIETLKMRVEELENQLRNCTELEELGEGSG